MLSPLAVSFTTAVVVLGMPLALAVRRAGVSADAGEFLNTTSCEMMDHDRVECGHFGIDEGGCTSAGCCWKPTSTHGAPWCFRSAGEPARPQCRVPDSSRRDCGFYGVDRQSCEAKQCCWAPSHSGAPWCFHGEESAPGPIDPQCQVPDPSKEDCGFFGVDQGSCAAKHCCWVPSQSGAPWCFHGKGAEPRAEAGSPQGPAAASTTKPAPGPLKCKGYPSARAKTCQFSNASRDGCAAKGCCWAPFLFAAPSSPPTTSGWCFHPEGAAAEGEPELGPEDWYDTGGARCLVPEGEMQACGSSTTTKELCELSQCCWAGQSQADDWPQRCFKSTDSLATPATTTSPAPPEPALDRGADTPGEQCQLRDFDKENCCGGDYGKAGEQQQCNTKEACESQPGCCWAAAPRRGVPWLTRYEGGFSCFRRTAVVPTNMSKMHS